MMASYGITLDLATFNATILIVYIDFSKRVDK